MLHVLQLIVAPAFALRKKSLVPFSLGVVAATVQYVLSDRTRAIYVGARARVPLQRLSAAWRNAHSQPYKSSAPATQRLSRFIE